MHELEFFPKQEIPIHTEEQLDQHYFLRSEAENEKIDRLVDYYEKAGLIERQSKQRTFNKTSIRLDLYRRTF